MDAGKFSIRGRGLLNALRDDLFAYRSNEQCFHVAFAMRLNVLCQEINPADVEATRRYQPD